MRRRQSSLVVAIMTIMALAGLPGIVQSSFAGEDLVSVYRMNAGGSVYTDSKGRVWRADEYADAGIGAGHRVDRPIANTSDDKLFQTERWGMNAYKIPIANGSYTLRLSFAEINPTSGERVFSVKQGNKPLLTDFQIAKEAGTFTAITKDFVVSVTDGLLDLTFQTQSNASSIAAIELLKRAKGDTGNPVMTSVYRLNSGGPAYTDKTGRVWRADEYFRAGFGGAHTASLPVKETDDDALYQSERWGLEGYDIPTGNGKYVLKLYFAEINPTSGRRVFTVKQGSKVLLDRFNISDAGGAFTAVSKDFPVSVTDGFLHLTFITHSNAASVSALELLRSGADGEPSVGIPSATTAAPPIPAPVPTSTSTTAKPLPTLPSTTSTTMVPAGGGNLTGWKLEMSDNFDTNVSEGNFLSVYGTRWSAYPTTFRDTFKKGQYNPGIISVTNGILNMRLHTNAAGVPQVAAPLPKLANGSHDQLYGRYEVRFRADAVDGYKTAWLLWPKSEVWPRDGEVDFPEGDLTDTISAFMHRQDGTSGGDQDYFGTSARYTDWHTAVTEWSPNRLVFILDGKVIGTSTSRVPNTPMHYVMQTETELNSSFPARSATGNVQVDYFRMWSYSPGTRG